MRTASPTLCTTGRSRHQHAPRPHQPSGATRNRPNYRRRQIVLGTIVIAALAFVVFTFAGAHATADDEPFEGALRPPAVYVVKPGDSLWSIVQRLAPERDPRPLVASLKRAAGGADLKVGQRVALPPALAGE